MAYGKWRWITSPSTAFLFVYKSLNPTPSPSSTFFTLIEPLPPSSTLLYLYPTPFTFLNPSLLLSNPFHLPQPFFTFIQPLSPSSTLLYFYLTPSTFLNSSLPLSNPFHLPQSLIHPLSTNFLNPFLPLSTPQPLSFPLSPSSTLSYPLSQTLSPSSTLSYNYTSTLTLITLIPSSTTLTYPYPPFRLP